MKVATADGHISTFLCPRMVTWSLRTALRTFTKPRAMIAKIISSASQFPKSRNHTSLAVDGVTHPRKKMMKEILRNGPINGDFQAPSMFSIYKEGIFSEKGLIDIHKQSQENIMLAQTKSKGSE